MKKLGLIHWLRICWANKFSLRLRLTLQVCFELVVTVVVSYFLSKLVPEELLGDWSGRMVLILAVISLVIGSILTSFLSRMYFDPIRELGRAMDKVGSGDFQVQMEVKPTTSREIRDIYEGFNMMTQELRNTEILQTSFVSNVSHEFKTPINAIEGYSMLLQGSQQLTAQEQAYVEKIIFNTQRLSTLAGNILLLSKIENQSITTNQSRFRLDEQIRQSILSLEGAWAAKDLEFDVDLERVEYYGNENLLYHVWSNLIGNAVKFSPQDGLIRIRLYAQAQMLHFVIEDQGPGIQPEALHHIFDKFYQADSSHTEEGNGLGLALVKRILSIEEGTVSAQNLSDGGCAFHVVLPIR